MFVNFSRTFVESSSILTDTDQVDGEADHAVDDVDVEERHDHHYADCAGEDDVHHAQDQEGDHQAPHLQMSCSHLMF